MSWVRRLAKMCILIITLVTLINHVTSSTPSLIPGIPSVCNDVIINADPAWPASYSMENLFNLYCRIYLDLNSCVESNLKTLLDDGDDGHWAIAILFDKEKSIAMSKEFCNVKSQLSCMKSVELKDFAGYLETLQTSATSLKPMANMPFGLETVKSTLCHTLSNLAWLVQRPVECSNPDTTSNVISQYIKASSFAGYCADVDSDLTDVPTPTGSDGLSDSAYYECIVTITQHPLKLTPQMVSNYGQDIADVFPLYERICGSQALEDGIVCLESRFLASQSLTDRMVRREIDAAKIRPFYTKVCGSLNVARENADCLEQHMDVINRCFDPMIKAVKSITSNYVKASVPAYCRNIRGAAACIQRPITTCSPQLGELMYYIYTGMLQDDCNENTIGDGNSKTTVTRTPSVTGTVTVGLWNSNGGIVPAPFSICLTLMSILFALLAHCM